MDNKLLQSVKAMHSKFGLENNSGPTHLTPEEKSFRIVALREEIDEYEEATELVNEYDALVDLMVFAVGTFERHGFPLQDGFDAVMTCNMKKELAGSSENSKRGFKRDLVKPAGWTGPEAKLSEILNKPVIMEQSKKYDSGKPELDLIPTEPLNMIADVLTFGAKKYGRNNWRMNNVPEFSRLYASILRHLMAWNDGQDNDPESGLSHLAHASTQLMFLLYHTMHSPSKDNRFSKGL
jgi:predicted HAD superfamily Cof-like phosphohydrolase